MHEPILNNYQVRRAFAGMVSNLPSIHQTARLEQAMMVCDFRTDQDYDEVRWSVLMTDYAVGNGHQFGYFL